MKTKIFTIIILAIILIFGIMFNANATETLIFAISTDVNQLDPADTNISQVVTNVFEGLVRFKAGTTTIEPCLATSWEISEDGKEIIFHLRKDVKFHDGTNFDADAVVFSFARQYDPNHPYHQYGKWNMWEYLFRDVDGMLKIDNYTVKLILKKPNVSVLTSLALYRAAIVSPNNAEKYKNDAFKHPCGTGPFKFVEWIKDDHVTLEANEDYWQKKARLDKLVFKVIPDPSARLMALEVGQVQGMEYPNPTDLKRIKENKGLLLMTEPAINVGYLIINNGFGYMDENNNGIRDKESEPFIKTQGYLEPLTKKKVRQAINMAIDKQSIVDNIFMGTAVKAKNGMPPFMLGYNDEIEDYSYDPEKAKKLLSEAGYPNGFEATLYVMPLPRPYMFDPFKVSEAIQSYLSAVGIKIEFYQIDWSTYLQETREGKHHLCLLGWVSDNGDPDNFMHMYATDKTSIGKAQNRAFYTNEKIDEFLSKALITYNNKKRAEYYEKIQEMIHEDAPLVYLAHSKQNIVFKKNIKDFVLNPLSLLYFYPVWVE